MKRFFQSFLKKLAEQRPQPHTIAALYGAVMAQARAPQLFTHYGLEDTLESRFELLTLHLFLLMRRLGREEQGVQQALTEFMVSDLDRSLREAGVGDVGVVKRMKHFMEGFYGRANAYENALNSTDEKEILRALDRNLFAAQSTDLAKLERMRNYIQQQSDFLNAQPLEDILAGRVCFKQYV